MAATSKPNRCRRRAAIFKRCRRRKAASRPVEEREEVERLLDQAQRPKESLEDGIRVPRTRRHRSASSFVKGDGSGGELRSAHRARRSSRVGGLQEDRRLGSPRPKLVKRPGRGRRASREVGHPVRGRPRRRARSGPQVLPGRSQTPVRAARSRRFVLIAAGDRRAAFVTSPKAPRPPVPAELPEGGAKARLGPGAARQ